MKRTAACRHGRGAGARMDRGLRRPSAKQGGDIVITYKDDVATLDPAIGYDWQNWSIIKSLFDGLMDYKPGTTELVPDLAESYEISPRRHDLHLQAPPRRQVPQRPRGHRRRRQVFDRARRSIRRRRARAPASSARSRATTTCRRQGHDSPASTSSTLTVKFELSRPDATFLHVMAINFAYVVPKEEVEKYGADFGQHPVGTGAFKMTEWTLGQRLVFEKNPDYWQPGRAAISTRSPSRSARSRLVALLRLQKGEVDVLGDGIPPAKFLEVKDDPR